MLKKIINFIKKYYIQQKSNYDIFLLLTGLPLLFVPIVGWFYIFWIIGRYYLNEYYNKNVYGYKKSLFFRLLLAVISFAGSLGAGGIIGNRAFLIYFVVSVYQVIESFLTTNEEFTNIKSKVIDGQKISNKRRILFFCLILIISVLLIIPDKYV